MNAASAAYSAGRIYTPADGTSPKCSGLLGCDAAHIFALACMHSTRLKIHALAQQLAHQDRFNAVVLHLPMRARLIVFIEVGRGIGTVTQPFI